jgi:hypothetical protein
MLSLSKSLFRSKEYFLKNSFVKPRMTPCPQEVWVGLLFFFISLPAFAQNTATVYGVITDSTNTPVQDVSISIVGSVQTPVYTNNKGEYTYIIPAEKEVTLIFNSLSYKAVKQTVKLATNEKRELTMKLVFNNQLSEVQVTDKNRFKTITRIDPLLISKLPSASQDFNAILFTLPGVSSRNELSSSYSVRGGNFDENLVYVNGVEIYRPFLVRAGQQEGLSFINPDMVSSVLFSAGGFEAKYGDKMSSVLDVQYRKPRKFAGSASGSFLGSTLHLEGASKNYRFKWIVGTRYKTNQYLVKGLNGTNAQYKPLFADIQTLVTYDLTDQWELQFLGYSASNKYQFVPVNRDTRFGTMNQALQLKMYFDGQEIDKFNTQLGALSATHRSHNDRVNLRFIGSAYVDNESMAYDIQSQYYLSAVETDYSNSSVGDSASNIGVGTFLNHSRSNLKANIYSAEHKGTYTEDDKQLLWGVKYSSENISDKISQWKYVDSAGFSIPHNDPEQIVLQHTIKQDINISSNRIAGYVQGGWQKQTKDTTSISLTAGIRANYWDFNNQALIGPRASVGLKPHWKKNYVFKFSTGYYYQPPFFREMLDVNGNVNNNIKAQTSIHFVLTSDHNFKLWTRPFKIVTEAYYKLLDNIIPYQVDNVQITYSAKNNANGFARGIDFKINGEFIKDLESWFSLSVMQTEANVKGDYYYTYLNNAGKQIIPGYTANNIAVDSVRHEPGYIPRPTDQRLNVGVFFQDKMPNVPDLKMHLNMIFGTGVPFGAPYSQPYQQTFRMPAYRRVDIGFSYQALKEEKQESRKNMGRYIKSIWISLEVFNLLGINNTVSYIWVQDVTSRQYAVPNYLTNRQLNVRMVMKF